MGCGSSTPSLQRNPASQLINICENYFLIDCGEGTQLQMRKFRVKFQRINHIFISHLHGDHYLGIIGLIQSMHLLGRKNDLHIYAHANLEELINHHLYVSQSKLNYKIVFHYLSYEKKEQIYDSKNLEIFSFPLKHRIPTCGFLLKEKTKPYKIMSKKIKDANLPYYAIQKMKAGENYINNEGKVYNFMDYTEKPSASYSYAYCSDTMFDPHLPQYINNVDYIYHESTFLQKDAGRANDTFHSTAMQAAEIAKLCGAKKLILGHFSVRYKNIQEFLKEAKTVFEETELAEDGKIIKIY